MASFLQLEFSNFGKLLKSRMEENKAGQTFQTFVFNCFKLHNLILPQAVPNPTHHTMRHKRLALVPTYFSAQILCAFPSRNITSTTTSYCLHCLHCLHWLQCLQSAAFFLFPLYVYTKTVPENWVSKQSFFVLILTTA